ncbi:MAG TPA: NAD(P)/FAD-dependent oxidoreductase [Methyloceanibacter sp.]|nr:NAD(P)/FAD-dependent oxidoreductase [Methyloceanibacter sp.]
MTYDVAIVGGGPAGLTVATLLARAGRTVVVAARPASSAPRPGETLAGAGLRLLRTLDLPVPAPGGPHRSLTGISSAWDGAPVETDYLGSPDGPAWLIERGAFDRALRDAAERAGATFLDGAVENARRLPGGWRLAGEGLSTEAAFVVDATGRAARMGRLADAGLTVMHDQIALWSVATGDAPERLERPMIERVADGWWFAVRLDPRRTYAAFHALAREGGAARANWRERLEETRYLAPLLQTAGSFEPPRGSPAGGARLAPVRGPAWAACGDAAMALDPLSSQGLFSAIAGGAMLARALGSDRADALDAYERRLDEIWRIYADRRAAYHVPATV